MYPFLAKTDSFPEWDMDDVAMQTPRPTLDVEKLDSPRTLLHRRKRVLKKLIAMYIGKKDKKATSKVVSKYRRKQTRLLGEKDEDPDPYDSDYVFYCLEGDRED